MRKKSQYGALRTGEASGVKVESQQMQEVGLALKTPPHANLQPCPMGASEMMGPPHGQGPGGPS